MFGRRKKEKVDFIETVSGRSTILPITDSQQGLDFLVSFFSAIRPASSVDKRPARENIRRVTSALHQSPVLLSNLQHAILSQLIRTDLSSALTESGIPLARGFWQEFFGRLRHKLLPPLRNENDFLYVLNRVFFHNDDYKWVEDISREDWVLFFESIGLSLHVDDKRILSQLLYSLKALSFQVAQLGLEKEVLNYMPEGNREDNPFVQQSYLVHQLEKELLMPSSDDTLKTVAEKIDWMMQQCYEALGFIRENHTQRGASLHQTYILILLANRLERISILTDLLDRDHRFDAGKFVDFFRMLVRNENRKNSILEFMSQTMGYLAYQIAEHKGAKGNKYITSTWAEYRSMLYSAMGGGAWICLVVLIKNLLIRVPMAIFWHGFAYSINYSLGFILIEETHTTLATKQPAFTASAVAGSLDTRRNTTKPNLYNLAVTVAKVSRSQTASFIGNLVIVFPGMFFIGWAYDKISGAPLASGETAMRMLRDQHPWQSLSLLYACNTGFFLFLSGIIAGYVQNKIQYGHIARRLQMHPILRMTMPEERLRRLASYVEKHTGSLVGNIALGFFLGMAGFVGEIFGIHFDIRHITISAGNTGLAVYGLGFDHIDPWYLATVIGGVLGIGFLNFLSSFSLAFVVAVKSRGVRLRDYPEFLGILWRYFRSHPLDFIRPRRRLPETEEG
ncbi:MAG: site-specific recombinase [Chitinophagaceae bacterium]|nr:site-specific recombinase [Chitinophagaceae bacterium]